MTSGKLKKVRLDVDDNEIRNDLKRYCAMDTWAEVRLIHRLRELAG